MVIISKIQCVEASLPQRIGGYNTMAKNMFETFEKTSKLEALTGFHKGLQTIQIDAGSTGTRSIIVHQDDINLSNFSNLADVKTCPFLDISSEYIKLTDDMKLPSVAKSDKISDKLEYIIQKIEGPSIGFVKLHAAKGSLMRAVGASVSNASSAELKVNQPQVFVNILIAIANSMLTKSQVTGKRFRGLIPIDLTLSLPYEDMKVKGTLSKFKEKLSGKYVIAFPRLPIPKVNADGQILDKDGNPVSESGQKPVGVPYAVQFELSKDRIFLVSEQRAAGEYFLTAKGQNSFGCNAVTIDVGGRSTGMILSTDRSFNDSVQETYRYGGVHLINMIKEKALQKYELQKVESNEVIKALSTGKLINGGRSYDVVTLINEAKVTFAEKLYENYSYFLESSASNLDSIDLVVVSGRVFGEILDEEGNIISPSIRAYFEQHVSASFGTKVEQTSVTYPIPWGLLVCRMDAVDSTDEFEELDMDLELEF